MGGYISLGGPRDQGHHGGKGGRPRKHANDRAAKASAQRAYRDRQRDRQLRAADDALAAIGSTTALVTRQTDRGHTGIMLLVTVRTGPQ
jgi:hypothetical protein